MSDMKDKILTTETARRMLSLISPIYDESYVGLWVHEAIAREYDTLWTLVNTFADQLFPETATWGIELWERRYGIQPDDNIPLEERRQLIVLKRSIPKPLTTKGLRTRIYNITGRWAEIVEHVSDFTFGVYLESTSTDIPADYAELIAYIDRHKPAHMSYEFAFQSSAQITIAIECGYWDYASLYAGVALTGTRPINNIVFQKGEGTVDADSDAKSFVFPYELAGTKPDINTGFKKDDSEIEASGDARGFLFPYPLSSPDEHAGALPEFNITSGVSDPAIRASPDERGFIITYIPCGTVKAASGTF